MRKRIKNQVELRFRKRKGAVILSRVLRRNHHERLLQRMGLIVHRNLRLTHRFQQAALCFRGRPIDLVGEDDVGENRTRHEFKRLLLAVEDRDADDIGGNKSLVN